MRVVSIIGPEQAGKTTIAAQLAGLEGENPESVELDRKSTRLNSSHSQQSRMPSSA